MKKLKLKTGETVLVDDEDYEIAKSFRWKLSNSGHVYYSESRPDCPLASYYLHSIILDPHKPFWVVHKDQNPLNCQKENLIITTPKEIAESAILNTGGKTSFPARPKGIHEGK